MALDVLQYATFTGPAFSEPFVRFELEKELNRLRLLPSSRGDEGRALQEAWEVYRRRLRELVARGGAVRVRNHILEPLVARLGYEQLEASSSVETREGREDGGQLMLGPNGERLRVWATALDEDLDAPSRRGRAYRFSHARIAQRVLLAAGERMGLLTNGVELRILISDPARPDSQIAIPVGPHWKRSRDVPDTYRLFMAWRRRQEFGLYQTWSTRLVSSRPVSPVSCALRRDRPSNALSRVCSITPITVRD